MKPNDECQGRGIFLTRDPNVIKPTDQVVIQKYMYKPHLIEGLKYDLRIYVMLCGVNPLRVYIYKDGLARFATVKYEKPKDDNIDNLFMHLTNYAINKESEGFVANTDKNNDDVGSKRSLQRILEGIELDDGEEAMENVQMKLYDIINKSLCMSTPHMTHLIRSCHPDDIENQLCFQILGFDVIIDSNLRPFLLEINQCPSLKTDSPIDIRIKRGLVIDVMKKLCLTVARKTQYKMERKARLEA